MADLKLPQLPDRNPVKLNISVMPDLHQGLTEYASYLNGQLVSLGIPRRGSRGFLGNSRLFKRVAAGIAVSPCVSATGAGGGA